MPEDIKSNYKINVARSHSNYNYKTNAGETSYRHIRNMHAMVIGIISESNVYAYVRFVYNSQRR